MVGTDLAERLRPAFDFKRYIAVSLISLKMILILLFFFQNVLVLDSWNFVWVFGETLGTSNNFSVVLDSL